MFLRFLVVAERSVLRSAASRSLAVSADQAWRISFVGSRINFAFDLTTYSALMTVTPCRPAPGRCGRRTSPASSHRAGRSASRVRRGRPPRVGARRKLGRRGEFCVLRVHTSGYSHGDLLEQPAVAVWIAERRERSVAATFGMHAANPGSPKQIGLIRDSCERAPASGIINPSGGFPTPTKRPRGKNAHAIPDPPCLE